MDRVKRQIGYTLNTLKENLSRTGDPLGIKRPYWSDWEGVHEFGREGKTLLVTGRMYQMLPYIRQTTRMIPGVRKIMAIPGAGNIMSWLGRVATDPALRLLARRQNETEARARRALRGISAGLQRTGCGIVYRPELDAYGGALLYDLGLREEALAHLEKVLVSFQQQDFSEIVTVDPHTTALFKTAIKEIKGFEDLQVRHYLEVLDGNAGVKPGAGMQNTGLPSSFVVHDSCVLVRDLDLGDTVYRVAERLGIRLVLPESSGRDTACCGGPIEYAFPELGMEVAELRARELAGAGSPVLSFCPICLMNLARYEERFGIRVWDMGEVLAAAVAGGGNHEGDGI